MKLVKFFILIRMSFISVYLWFNCSLLTFQPLFHNTDFLLSAETQGLTWNFPWFLFSVSWHREISSAGFSRRWPGYSEWCCSSRSERCRPGKCRLCSRSYLAGQQSGSLTCQKTPHYYSLKNTTYFRKCIWCNAEVLLEL